MTGTSMAAPQVAGLAALLIQWWRARTGATPSPALVKALLVNGAEDLAGGEQWRRLSSHGFTPGPNGTQQVVGLGFAPDRLVENGTRALEEVAGAAQVTRPGRWAYDAAADTLSFRRFGSGRLDARDSAPLAAAPNADQGWGRVSLANIVLQAPDVDRGPKIVHDQRHAFTSTGEEFLLRVRAADASRPLRITLAWTDAPAAAGAHPALMNDLDLEVVAAGGGQVWVGNHFADGFSTTGGDFDDRDNLECVYLERPVAGETYEIRVVAANLVANARPPWDLAPWQDFALVIDNAVEPALSPVALASLVDGSASVAWAGHAEGARAAARALLGRLEIGDHATVVGLGTSATVAHPAPPASRAAEVATEADRDQAVAAVASLDFGGGADPGAGIAAARDLLAPVPLAAARKAMVLLCDGPDGSSPSALTVAATLPPGMALYGCALGPVADADTLEQLADLRGGRFLYVEEADELLEAMTFVHAHLAGEGVVASQFGTTRAGDPGAVGAFVDARAEAATLTVAWADPALRFSTAAPTSDDMLRVRLVAPGERRLHAGDGSVRRTLGPGFARFHLTEPPAGAWRVEIEHGAAAPLRFHVGATVRSPLRLALDLQPRRSRAGSPLSVSARVFDGDAPVQDVRAVARFTRPREGIAAAQARLATAMAAVTVPDALRQDGIPEDLARLLVLRRDLIAAGEADPLRRHAHRRVLREIRARSGGGTGGSAPGIPRLGASTGGGAVGRGGGGAGADGSAGAGPSGGGGTIGIVGGGGAVGGGLAVGLPLSGARGASTPGSGAAAGGATTAAAPGRTLGGSFSSTLHPGSYVVRVDAAGVSEHSGARFTRVDTIATVVGASASAPA